jgi:hypothetical protein
VRFIGFLDQTSVSLLIKTESRSKSLRLRKEDIRTQFFGEEISSARKTQFHFGTCVSVRPGTYATEINIYNYHLDQVAEIKNFFSATHPPNVILNTARGESSESKG